MLDSSGVQHLKKKDSNTGVCLPVNVTNFFRTSILKNICNRLLLLFQAFNLVGIYLLKVNTRNTRTNVWHMFKVNNKDTRTTPLAPFRWLHCYLWTYFTHCYLSIVNFEHVIVGWEIKSDQVKAAFICWKLTLETPE